MALIRDQKTSFSAGEIAPLLLGRGDLRCFANGARKLRNVFLHATGGASRRSGLRLIDVAPGPGRLLAFEFNTEQVYLLLFSDMRLDVYCNESKTAQLATPWNADQLAHLNFTQSADTLLVVHPDVAPRKITRASHTAWNLANWTFYSKDSRIFMPHHKFADAGVTLSATSTVGSVVLTASAPIFSNAHVGARFRIADKEVEVFSILSSIQAWANVLETLVGVGATADWTEQSFSAARGWPISACFHQDRLVIGGSRDLPNRLLLSKSSDLFNFDLGEGLDDCSIEFEILSDQVNAIRNVFSGRHLQVFTSGAEWMVSGEPLTPSSIQLFRETRVGSPVDRVVPLRNVDGATLFVSRSGQQLREFLFTDAEQAYQANDLAMLSHHLFDRPLDMAFDQARRLLHIIMSNGTMATLTAYREEEVNGWTLQETQGSFLAVATVGEATYVLVRRQGGVYIEVFDESMHVDAGLAGVAAEPKMEWSGAGHLEGERVKVVADGAVAPDAIVEGGAVVLGAPASSMQLGLPFTHTIEPLPPSVQGLGSTQGIRLRPVAFTFRLWETPALFVDTGRGLTQVALQRFGGGILDTLPQPFGGDVTVRTIGWRNDGISPLWRIEQEVPLSFSLLSVSTQLSISG